MTPDQELELLQLELELRKRESSSEKPSAMSLAKDSVQYATSPQGLLESVPDLARIGAAKLGQFSTETFSKPDIRRNRITGKVNDVGSMNPNVAAALGTGIAMTPDILMAAATPKVDMPAPKMVKNVGSGVANQLEQLSGAAPGSVSAAFKDSGIQFSPGKKEVQSIYNAAKNTTFPIRQGFEEITDNKEFVKQAIEAAKDGSLNPAEALEARKALGKIKRTIPDATFQRYSDVFDGLAKEVFSGADSAFKKAVYGESLRNFLPQNKYGGASSFKLGIITALNKMGEAAGASDKIFGKMFSAAMSPAIVGGGATLAGIASRNIVAPAAANIPKVSAVLDSLAKSRRKKK